MSPVGSSIASRRCRSLIAGVSLGWTTVAKASLSKSGWTRTTEKASALEVRRKGAAYVREPEPPSSEESPSHQPKSRSWSWSCSPAAGWAGSFRALARSAALVAAIQRSDGYVEYEWDITKPARKPGGAPPWPKWLVDRLGVDYFYNVVAVDLDDRAADLDLVRVGNLTKLRSLQLSRSQVTDAGLEFLQGLTCLKRLTLRVTGVTDAGLATCRA